MIVIHIFGTSNTGKTYLAETLCRQLASRGSVETIKHLGHHIFTLEEGKDTTVHYQSGASGSTGIDSEKSVTILRIADLIPALDAAANRGADFCIVEGFKTAEIPGVALGDVTGAGALLRDPSPEEILSNLSRFPIWTTPTRVLGNLLRNAGPEMTGALLIFDSISGEEICRVEAAARTCPGVVGTTGSLIPDPDSSSSRKQRGCLAVAGRTATAVTAALQKGAEEVG